MQGKSKQIYLLKEDSPYDGQPETLSGRSLWQVLSQPLMWHWVVYDFLMTVFCIILFTVLFDNFV